MYFINRFNNKGFTIAEVLIAVAIITVLVTLTMNGYNGLLRKEKVRVAVRTIDIIAKAARAYSKSYLASSSYAEHDLSNTVEINAQYGLQIASHNSAKTKSDPSYQYFNYSLQGTVIIATLQEDMSGIASGDSLTYDLNTDIWGGPLNIYR